MTAGNTMAISKTKSGSRQGLAVTLARSSSIAQKGFKSADPVFHSMEAALKKFDKALAKAASRYEYMDDEKDADLKAALAPLLLEKRTYIQERFKDLAQAQIQRKKDLDNFSLLFFGKTMAGKSTTIEALTGGNGATIGAGDPDFTRDISGKNWDGLTLVDTPGLLGFREDLYGIAEAYVDRADLICMVLSDDSIEPQLFQRMREIRGQNKHLVVLLNVKAANNPILRHEPEHAFDEREISELVAFIRERLQEVFGDEPVVVIPYCANAAFEAHRVANEVEREYLWQESRIDDVIGYLIHTIERRGVPIRATAGFDSLAHYAQSITDDVESDLPALTRQLAEVRRKRGEAERLFGRVLRDSASDLSHLKVHFQTVHEDLHELAWEFARGERKESVKAAYRRACKWDDVQDRVSRFRNDVHDRTTRNLEQFKEALGQDLTSVVNFRDADVDLNFNGSSEDWDKGGWKRKTGKVIRTAGVAAGGLAGGYVGAEAGAFVGSLLGGPPGTVIGGAIGFLGGFVGSMVASWVTKKIGDVVVESGMKDQRSAHKDLREIMRDQLWKTYRQLNDDLYHWLTGLVESVQGAVVRMLDEYAITIEALTEEGMALTEELHRSRHNLAHSSFTALLHEVHPAFQSGKVRVVNATQWMQYRAKILVSGRDDRPVSGLVIGRGGEFIRAR